MTSPAEVEASLLRLARQLVPGKRVVLIGTGGEVEARGSRGSEGDACSGRVGHALGSGGNWRGESMTELPLRCGGAVHGRLQVIDAMDCPDPRPAALRRLAIACTMAACALENLRQHFEWGWKCDEEPAEDGRSRGGGAKPAGVVHDATFLNAVFPFALGQAKRHREPVSLLCLGIDRLSAIQDLLGPEVVDRLVQEVCRTVASSIRSSDIVARLDDDRIIVLLIRARARNAEYVAQKVLRAVAEKTQDAAELGCATVSIGLAEFPGDARSASSLLEAADDALVRAQRGGTSQIALAEARPVPGAESPEIVSSACSSF